MQLEKQKNDLSKELEDLTDRLEEQGGATAVQADLSRKRENELAQSRATMDKQTEEHEQSMSDLRKKQAAAVGDLEEQLEATKKGKSKVDKDYQRLVAEHGDTASQLEDLTKSKVRERLNAMLDNNTSVYNYTRLKNIKNIM